MRGSCEVRSQCTAALQTKKECSPEVQGPLGPLGFEGAQHRQTLRPSSSRDPQQSPASFRSAVKDTPGPNGGVLGPFKPNRATSLEGDRHHLEDPTVRPYLDPYAVAWGGRAVLHEEVPL